MIIRYIAGPVVGAAIGYFTNFLAVKMLFFPRNEIKVFGHKLPFTPGAIPKGKPRLAKAVGKIISTMLLTEEDIEKKLNNPELRNRIADKVIESFEKPLKDNFLTLSGSEENYSEVKNRISDYITQQILQAVKNINLSQIVESEGASAIKEKVAGTMLQMFVSDDLIHSILKPLGDSMQNSINEKGALYISPEVEKSLDSIEQKTAMQIIADMGINKEQTREVISNLCQKAMSSAIKGLTKNLDIASMIEEKINAMNVLELENLVLSVMKKELDTIVNLGAIIGAILGTINIFF
ncbi:MAG: DUF445 family protein [Treponema sp.]|nr:DUF445 family protein [Treponema sp.]